MINKLSKLNSIVDYLPVLVTPVILFAPVWLTGKALFWGTPFLQFMPWRELAWSMILKGQLPLWDPWVGMGAPLAANLQSAFFYPPNWMLFLLDSIGGVGWMAWGQTILVVAHLIWAGLGMMFLARQLGLNRLAQTISGLSFCLSGYLVARAGFLSINAAAAWLPWVILAANRFAGPFFSETGANFRQPMMICDAFFLGLCIGLQLLAGHAQTSYYTLLLLGFWVILWSYRAGRWKALGSAVLRLAAAMLFALCLASIQLVPTAEYLLQSQRASSVGYDFAMNYSFLPFRFITLISPNLFGSPALNGYLTASDNYWEDAIYMGLLPFLLALSAFFSALGLLRKRKAQTNPASGGDYLPLSLTLGLVTLVIFILALGKYTPVFPFLYHYVPTFNLFQAPTRFTLLAEFSLSLLASIGVMKWRRPEGKSLSWTYRGIVAACAFLLAAGAGWFMLRSVQPAMFEAIAFTGFAGIICGVATLTAPRVAPAVKDGVWSWLVVIFVSIDLLLAGWGLNPGASQDLYTRPSTAVAALSPTLNGHRLYLSASDENELKFNRFFTFKNLYIPETWQNLRNILLPDGAILDRVSSVNNFDPLLPDRYVQWMAALDQVDAASRANLLALMDVGAVETVDKKATLGVSFAPVSGGARIRWLSCTISAGNRQDAWEKLLSLAASKDTGSIAAQGVIEGLPTAQTVGCNPAYQTEIKTIQQDPDQISIAVSSQAEGWLMLSQTWYPGWQAAIDEQPAPIYRADFLFQAVKVPAGVHRVSFTYRPASFYLGAAVSGVTVFISFVFILFTRKNKTEV